MTRWVFVIGGLVGATGLQRQAAAQPRPEPPNEAREGADQLTPVPPPPAQSASPPPAYRGEWSTPSATTWPTEAPRPSMSRITSAKLSALSADLQALAARGGGGVVEGVLSMVTGGLTIGLGAIIDDPFSPYLYVLGGSTAARGLVHIALIPDASGTAVNFAHMPMTTEEEIQARLVYGESELQSLAERNLWARIVDGSLSLAAGLAVIPVYLAPNGFAENDVLFYFVLIGAGLSAVGGLLTLIVPSDAERRWGAYQEMRRRLDAAQTNNGVDDEREQSAQPTQRRRDGVKVSWSAMPHPNGAMIGISARF